MIDHQSDFGVSSPSWHWRIFCSKSSDSPPDLQGSPSPLGIEPKWVPLGPIKSQQSKTKWRNSEQQPEVRRETQRGNCRKNTANRVNALMHKGCHQNLNGWNWQMLNDDLNNKTRISSLHKVLICIKPYSKDMFWNACDFSISLVVLISPFSKCTASGQVLNRQLKTRLIYHDHIQLLHSFYKSVLLSDLEIAMIQDLSGYCSCQIVNTKAKNEYQSGY